MKKAVKRALKAVGIFLAFLLILVLALPLWIGPVATMAVNGIVPDKIDAPFELGEFGLNQYSGRIHVGALEVGNPEGFKKENCVELSRLDVDVAMTSVMSDTIRIEEIVVDGLTVSTDVKGSNFKKIAENASGEESAKSDAAAERQKPEKEDGAEDGKKVVIDVLRLKNIRINIGKVPVLVPDMEIKGLGADNGEGVTFTEAWQTVLAKVLSGAGAIVGAVGDIGKGAAKLGVDATGAAAGVVSGAGSTAASAVGDAASVTADAVKGLGSTTAGAVNDIGSAVKDVRGAVKDAGKAIKHAFKKKK